MICDDISQAFEVLFVVDVDLVAVLQSRLFRQAIHERILSQISAEVAGGRPLDFGRVCRNALFPNGFVHFYDSVVFASLNVRVDLVIQVPVDAQLLPSQPVDRRL